MVRYEESFYGTEAVTVIHILLDRGNKPLVHDLDDMDSDSLPDLDDDAGDDVDDALKETIDSELDNDIFIVTNEE